MVSAQGGARPQKTQTMPEAQDRGHTVRPGHPTSEWNIDMSRLSELDGNIALSAEAHKAVS